MATLRQIQANRLNAQKSTGPKTPEGKSASSQNALKSGLDAESQFVLGETREDFALLQSEYYDRFAPTTPELRFQVDSLIRNEWMLRRFFRVEPQLWEFHVQLAERGTGVELGEVFANANPIFMRLERRMRHAERAYKDAMTEIRRLQAAAPPASPAQPEETTSETEDLGSFRTPALAGEEMRESIPQTDCDLNQQLAPVPVPAKL